VKLARVGRYNGTYKVAAIKKILSPYADDRSAVTDCVKIARSGFAGRRAVLICGFEMTGRPFLWLIEAFEAVAARHATLGTWNKPRCGIWCIRSSPAAACSHGRFLAADSGPGTKEPHGGRDIQRRNPATLATGKNRHRKPTCVNDSHRPSWR
jgi:hypothetical protein